jgi:site-specific DNA recombinase
MNAAVYARYSSDNQRPTSIEDQHRKCRQHLEPKGWKEVAFFSDSEISGTVARARRGYQQLLAAAKERRFDVIVVDELSRLTRDQEELAALHKRLRFYGVGLVALADGLDTIAAPGAAGPIMAIKGLINEAELEANAHRSRRGLEGRALAGLHAGGAPFGYRTRAVHADRPGDPEGTGQVIGYEYVIHEKEAEVIRRIFRLYAEGMSTRGIAALLNAEGVAPPAVRWRNRKGVAKRTWAHGAIAGDPAKGIGILNNEKYIGRLVWNRSTWPRDPDRDGEQVRRDLPKSEWVVKEVPHLRIVSQDLWEAVKDRQRRRSREGVQSAAHWRNRRLLSGLLVCAQCGGHYVLRGKQTYSCGTRQNRGTSVCSCVATVNAVAAERAVLEDLRQVFCTGRILEGIIAEAHERWAQAQSQRRDQRASAQSLRDQLAEAEAEIQRLVKAIKQGVLVEELTEEMRAAQVRRDHLHQEIQATQGTGLPPGLAVLPDAVRQIVTDLPRMLAAGQMEKVKSVLKRLVGQIEVHEDAEPGEKRPGATLVYNGQMQGVLELVGKKVKGGHSPGGIRTRDLMAENHAS